MTTAVLTQTTPSQVLIHPLVLLSIVDHYRRVVIAEDETGLIGESQESGQSYPCRRVVGVLLGQVHGSTAIITNSFARKHNTKYICLALKSSFSSISFVIFILTGSAV